MFSNVIGSSLDRDENAISSGNIVKQFKWKRMGGIEDGQTGRAKWKSLA